MTQGYRGWPLRLIVVIPAQTSVVVVAKKGGPIQAFAWWDGARETRDCPSDLDRGGARPTDPKLVARITFDLAMGPELQQLRFGC